MASCSHKNPLHHAYCVICGVSLARVRCPRCGAVCDGQFIFCGQCGENLKHNAQSEDESSSVKSHSYNLDSIIAATELDNAPNKSAETNTYLVQDDIQAMIAKMKKDK